MASDRERFDAVTEDFRERMRRHDRYFYGAMLTMLAFLFGAMVATDQATEEFGIGLLWGILLSYAVTKFIIACRDQ